MSTVFMSEIDIIRNQGSDPEYLLHFAFFTFVRIVQNMITFLGDLFEDLRLFVRNFSCGTFLVGTIHFSTPELRAEISLSEI